MILYHSMRLKTWEQMKLKWTWLIDLRGYHEINRPAPTGYSHAPELLKGKVEGPGFVMYPESYDDRKPNHTIRSGASIYGNCYCSTVNPF